MAYLYTWACITYSEVLFNTTQHTILEINQQGSKEK